MTGSVTIEHMLSDEERKKNERAEARARFNQAVSLVTIIVLVAFWLWATYKTSQQPKVSTLTIDNLQATGPTDLCPGDALQYSYEFEATGEGVLDVDATAWRTDPPQTVVFSQARRFVLAGEVHEHVREQWIVPATYIDLGSGLAVPMPSGNYKRLLAITSPSRSTISAVGRVEYSIRADCP